MFNYIIPEDAADPSDIPHDAVYEPIPRPLHDRRKHTLLTDAYAELDRLSMDARDSRFVDPAKRGQLLAAFHQALIDDVVSGGFLSTIGFKSCDGVELANLGSVHARVGPYIVDWQQGPHRQGAYVVDSKQFAAFLEDEPLTAERANIIVHQDAPVAVRFFCGEGLRLAQSRTWPSQKVLGHALATLFKKRYPNAGPNQKLFDMLANGYLT